MNRKHLLFLLLLLALIPTNIYAQAKIAIYGTIGTEKSEVNNAGWTKAGTFGLYYGLANLGPLAVSIDARGDLSSNINSGLIGPRVALHFPLFPLKPYAELIAGISSYSTQNNGDKNATDLNYRWVGGIDTTILPHLDWRIAEFSYSGGGITQGSITRHPQTLSTGLVLRF
ncbi:MAG: porin family protein [Acidobacteriota bacterium]|nr:porin family protein [Acidobacteriota bacterium]